MPFQALSGERSPPQSPFPKAVLSLDLVLRTSVYFGRMARMWHRHWLVSAEWVEVPEGPSVQLARLKLFSSDSRKDLKMETQSEILFKRRKELMLKVGRENLEGSYVFGFLILECSLHPVTPCLSPSASLLQCFPSNSDKGTLNPQYDQKTPYLTFKLQFASPKFLSPFLFLKFSIL